MTRSEPHEGDSTTAYALPDLPRKAIPQLGNYGFRRQGNEAAQTRTSHLETKINNLCGRQDRLRPDREKLLIQAKKDCKDAKQLKQDSAQEIDKIHEDDLESLGRKIATQLDKAIEALSRTLTRLEDATHVQTKTDHADTTQKLSRGLRALGLRKDQMEKSLTGMKAAAAKLEEEMVKWNDSDQSDESTSSKNHGEVEESDIESYEDSSELQSSEKGHAPETADHNTSTQDTTGAATSETQPANEQEPIGEKASVRESLSDSHSRREDKSDHSEQENDERYQASTHEDTTQSQRKLEEFQQENGPKEESGQEEEVPEEEVPEEQDTEEEDIEEEDPEVRKKRLQREKREDIRMQMMVKSVEIGKYKDDIKSLKKKISRMKRRLGMSSTRRNNNEVDVEDVELEEKKAEKENEQELNEYNLQGEREEAMSELQVEKAALDIKYCGPSTRGGGKLPHRRMVWLQRLFEKHRSSSDRVLIMEMFLRWGKNDTHWDTESSNSDASDDDHDGDEEASETTKTVHQRFLGLQAELIKKTQDLESHTERILETLLGHKQIYDLIRVLRREKDLEDKWLEHLKNSGRFDTAGDSLMSGKHGHLFIDDRDEELSIYTKLGEGQFRVLILVPALEAYYPIICKMETWSMDSLSTYAGGKVKEYAALSYFWDSEICNGRLYFINSDHEASVKDSEWGSTTRTAYQVRIRNNLYRALLRLRQCGHNAQPVALWVDFLCINQKDMSEKTQQLARMVDIYSRASNVCIWLGESDNDGRSDEAMQFIPAIMDFALLDRHAHDAEQARKWYALSELMRDRWFSRRWVVQEIALAKDATVHCGGGKVQWSDFADAASLLISNQETIRSLFDDVSEWREGRNTIGDVTTFGASILLEATSNLFRRKPDGDIKKPTKSIEYLATSLKTFDTADPRDLIYSLVSIASDTGVNLWSAGSAASAHTPELEVDYKKPQVVVFKDFTKFCVNTSGSLDIICRPWSMPITDSQTDSLPSWIPLLENSEFGAPGEVYSGRKNGDGLVGPAGSANYQASGQLLCRVKFKLRGDPSQSFDSQRDASVHDTPRKQDPMLGFADTEDVLVAKGLRLAEITKVSPRNTGGVIHRESLKMGGWKGFKRNTNSVPDRIWRTLVADRDQNGHIPPSWYQRACLRCLEIADTFNNGDLNVGELLLGKSEMLRKYLSRVRNVTWNRRFFTTELPDSGSRQQRTGKDPEGQHWAGVSAETPAQDMSDFGDGEKMRPTEDGQDREEYDEGVEETRQAIDDGNDIGQASTEDQGEGQDSVGGSSRVQQNLFGLCPPDTEEGDIICILFGCSVPVILRPRPPTDYFVLVGEAYVHGKMDGEAIEDYNVEDGSADTVEFQLL